MITPKKALLDYLLLLFIIFLSLSCSNEDRTNDLPFIRKYSLEELGKSQYIGSHRGMPDYPEGSLEGVKAAILNGYKMIEIDPSMTKDSILIVHHDLSIDRLSNGTGAVSSYSYQELLNFDFGIKKGDVFKNTKICRLDEMLSLIDELGACVELDFSTNAGCNKDVINLAYNSVVKQGMIDRTLFCCKLDYCNYIDSLSMGGANLNIIMESGDFKGRVDKMSLFNKRLSNYASVRKALISKELVDYCHQNGLKVSVWTINDEQECLFLKNIGCDYILSDSITPSKFNRM